MNCTNINTAAEILNTFRACNNPGEEIELFECLATRDEPPIGAFVEIVKVIKLEPILALTIQAFGKITNPDIKAQLKESTDLLELLSQKVESVSSDLIKWSAATAIEEIGFDFLLIAQYLSETPKAIADRLAIVKLQELNEKDIVGTDKYKKLVCFWTYNNWKKLMENEINFILALGLNNKITNSIVQGKVYRGRVVRIIPIGVFVEIMPGKEGFVHISQFAEYRVHNIENLISNGDQLIVKVREIDNKGRINLTRIDIKELEFSRSYGNCYPEWVNKRLAILR